jgi:hypothetical protein
MGFVFSSKTSFLGKHRTVARMRQMYGVSRIMKADSRLGTPTGMLSKLGDDVESAFDATRARTGQSGDFERAASVESCK